LTNGKSALMAASFDGSLALVQALLAGKADVNATDDDGGTALMGASQNGHLDVMQALIAKGANVSARRTDGRTALSVAADADTKALLIQAGARL
jgi:ankyrin repeat protein